MIVWRTTQPSDLGPQWTFVFRVLKKELPTEVVTEMAATSFAEFLLDNIDLVRQLEDAFMDPQHVPSDPILSELERKAALPL